MSASRVAAFDVPLQDAMPPGESRILGHRRGVLIVVLLGAAVAVIAGLSATGSALFVIESPSMGTAAPVGSVVLTQRSTVAHLRVGDIATYRVAPDGETRTHRVVKLVEHGFIAKGDINGEPDAMVVRPSMLVGRVVAVVPALGRIVRLAPWLIGGVVLVMLVTASMSRVELRSAVRLLGITSTTTGVLTLQHPLLDWAVLSQRSTPHALLLELVTTGLLPTRFSATSGDALVLNPGAAAVLRAPVNANGGVRVDAALGLEPWGWVVLVLVCLLPLLVVLTVGLPARTDETGE